jgi:hypothetical protein
MYVRNPTIWNIENVFNSLHSFVRDQTVSNGTLLETLETEYFISRNITDLCLIERISFVLAQSRKIILFYSKTWCLGEKTIIIFFIDPWLLLWWWLCVCVCVCVGGERGEL